MMIAALVALGAGASGGIFLAVRHFLRKPLPATVALLHGLGGAIGFTFVLLTVVREPSFAPIREVLYLLIATVLLGCVNLLFHIRRVRHRTSLILLHGLTAISAASMLIRAIVIHPPEKEAQAKTTVPEPHRASPAVEPDATARTAAPPAASVDSLPAPSSGVGHTGTGDAGSKAPAKEFAVDDAVRRALDRPITFNTRSAQVGADSSAVITGIANALKSHPEVQLIEVQGHADERGDDARNVELTRARARAIIDALVANGVARERLHGAGYGARCPADSSCGQRDRPEGCHSATSWERDRRVVFLVLQVGGVSFRGSVVCDRGVDLIPPDDRRFHAPGARE